MNNKRISIIIFIFISVFLFVTAVLAVTEHIPFIGKALSLVFAVILITFVIIFFVIISRRKQ